MRGAHRSSPRFLAAALAALLAAGGRADEGRRVIVPGAAPAESATTGRAQSPDDMAELVGPTEAQKARAKAAIEAKAKADADAKAKLEAEAKAKVEAEAKARADAERKLREEAEARARADAERKSREEQARRAEEEKKARELAEARQRTEAEAKAKLAEKEREGREAAAKALAELEAAAKREQESKAAAAAQAKLDEEARVRTEIEARVRAQVERELSARNEKEAKARAKADAKAKALADRKAKAEARAQAKAEAKARREAKRRGKAAPTAPMPLPEVPAAMVASARSEPGNNSQKAVLVPLAPLVAEPQAAGKHEGTQVAMMTPPSQAPAVVMPAAPQSASRTLVLPADEQPRTARQLEVQDALQLGPQGLWLNRLTAGADVTPGVLRGTFGYSLTKDDAGSMHHFFQLGAESARPPDGVAHDWSWSAQLGLAPSASSAYGVQRKAGAMTDNLGWSAWALGASATRSFAQLGEGFSLTADAQLYNVSLSYQQNANQGGQPISAALDQLRLRATGQAVSGRFTGLFSLAAHAYLGDSTDKLHGMQLRGVFLQDDLAGLAAAPQGLEARLGGRVELPGQLAAAFSYTYVGYSSPDWSAAHLLHGELSDRFGRFQAALGLTWQYDAPVVSAPGAGLGDYSSMFLTGSIGYAF